MKDTMGALTWIVAILKKHNIQFQIAGGLAARLYGSSRELADIDIDVTKDCFENIQPDVKNQIIYGPKKYVDKNWNLMLMTLKYRGQIIDLAYGAKIFDQNKKKWSAFATNFSNSTQIKVYNTTLPVITLKNLLAYKKKLQRKVDKEDIRALTQNTRIDQGNLPKQKQG